MGMLTRGTADGEKTFWEEPLAQFGSEVLSHWAFQIEDNKIVTFSKLPPIHRPVKQRGIFQGNVPCLSVPHSAAQMTVYI
jgi:hypothetical protein